MLNKILSIVGSIRFWLYTLSSASVYVGYVEANGFSWSGLLTAIGAWLGVVGITGGLDKWFANRTK